MRIVEIAVVVVSLIVTLGIFIWLWETSEN